MKSKETPVIEPEAAIQTPNEERFLWSFWKSKIDVALAGHGVIDVLVYEPWQVDLVGLYGIKIPPEDRDRSGRIRPRVVTLKVSTLAR